MMQCLQIEQNLQLQNSLQAINNIQPNPIISQLLLIQQQSDFISQLVRNQSSSKKWTTLSTQLQDLSFDSPNYERIKRLNTSLSAISLCKEQRFFQQDSFEEALNQVKIQCSKKTFNLIKQKFKLKKQNRCEYRLTKQIKYNQQLMQKCLKLTQQVAELKLKLQNSNQKLKNEQKKRLPRNQPGYIDKGEMFLKWQKTILHKQKIQTQIKKKLNKQFTCLQQQRQQNEKLRQQIEELLNKLQTGNKQNFEHRKYQAQIMEIVKYIKQQMKIQRQFNEQQAKQCQKSQTVIEQIIRQLKQNISYKQ